MENSYSKSFPPILIPLTLIGKKKHHHLILELTSSLSCSFSWGWSRVHWVSPKGEATAPEKSMEDGSPYFFAPPTDVSDTKPPEHRGNPKKKRRTIVIKVNTIAMIIIDMFYL